MLIIRLQLHQNSVRRKGSEQKQGMMRHRRCIMQGSKEILKLLKNFLSGIGQLTKYNLTNKMMEQ